MKLIIAASILAVSSAATFNPYYEKVVAYQGARPRANVDRAAVILRSNAETNERGYQYSYEADNGIQAQESGQEADGIQAQGSYSYTGDDGRVYSVHYTAGSGGVQVQGDHLPTPPPVPEEIARALQQNSQDEARGIFDDGSYHDGKYSNGEGTPVVAARNYQRQPGFRY